MLPNIIQGRRGLRPPIVRTRVNRTRVPFRDREQHHGTCTGHKYDPFGVRKIHIYPLDCSEAMKLNGSYGIQNYITPCTSLTQAFMQINDAQQHEANDQNLTKPSLIRTRQDVVEGTTHMTELYHIPLDSDIENWNTLEKASRQVKKHMRHRGVLDYPFNMRKSTSRSRSLEVVLTCGHSDLFQRYTHSQNTRANKARAPLDCEGILKIRVYPRERILAVRHSHKHHSVTFSELRPKTLPRATVDKIEHLFNEGLVYHMPKANFLDYVKIKFPEVSRATIESKYDKLLYSHFKCDNSDWRSVLNFYESHPSIYAPFVFYQGNYMGLAVILKEVITKLEGNLDSLAIDSTHQISKHHCEMFVANATIDRTGVPVGYMFIKLTSKVFRAIEASKSLPVPNEAVPLEQCDVARDIQEFAKLGSPTKPKTALFSSFLLLLRGTDKTTYTIEGSERCFHTRPEAPPDSITTCNMASELLPESPLLYKQFPGIRNMPLLTCDKDLSEVKSFQFVFPDVPLQLCFWHTAKSVKQALCNSERRVDFIDWIKMANFPEYLKTFFPALFDQTEHSPESCPYEHPTHSLSAQYKCVQCHEEYYREWVDSRVSSQTRRPVNAVRFSAVLNMLERHARAFSDIPVKFSSLRELSNTGDSVKYYNPEAMKRMIIYEMVEFCLSNRLLGALQYFWINWYCDEWFNKWTQCEKGQYNAFTTNMIAEAFNSVFKHTLGNKRGCMRLDHLVYIDYSTLHPKRIRKLTTLLEARSTHDHFDSFYENETSWIRRRWDLFGKLFKIAARSSETLSTETLREDCIAYGTDAQMFVCSCHVYRSHNVHLCKHIVRCIDISSFTGNLNRLIKLNLRPRRTAPYYLPDADHDLSAIPENIWGCLQFKEEYQTFWNELGRNIISSQHDNTFEPPSLYASSELSLQSDLVPIAPPPTSIDSLLNAQVNESDSESSDTEERHRYTVLFPVPCMANPSPPFNDLPIEDSREWRECMNCIPVSFNYRTEVFNAFQNRRSFLALAVAIFQIEYRRLTSRSTSTIHSREYTPSMDTTVYLLPEPVRELFLLKAYEYNILLDANISQYNLASVQHDLPRYMYYASWSSR